MSDEQPITPEQAAALLGVEASTLKQWRWRGEGPPYRKISRRKVVYLRSEVIAWRDEGRVDPVDSERVAWRASTQFTNQ